MAKKEFTGLWVPIEILQNEEMTSTEKLVLAVIYGLSKDGRCTASNQYIAEAAGSGFDHVKKIIPKLARNGYIHVKSFRDDKKIIRRTIYTT